MANEKRLIDANALKDALSNLEVLGGHKYYRKGMDDALHFHMPNIIDDAPTVDAVEVVHSRWVNIVTIADAMCLGFCENCRTEQKAQNATALKAYHKYCRWCGAKMDGDGDGYMEVDYIPHDRTTDDGFCDRGERREGE